MQIKRHIPITILIASLPTASYIRELTFLALNAAIAGHEVIYKTHRAVPAFLLVADAERLMMLKWAAAGLFTVLFFVLTASLLFLYFRSRRMIRLTVMTYVALCLAAGFLLALYSVSQIDMFYSMAITLGHIVQSPLPAMVLFPVGLLIGKFSEIRNPI